MRILLFTFCFLSLTSCFSTYVYFDEPQPSEGTYLTEAPLELQGKWHDSTTISLKITPTCLIISERIIDSVDKSVRIDADTSCLSDSIRLHKAGDYYVLNLLHKDKKWQVFIIEKQKNGDQVWYYPETAPYFGKGHGLKVKQIDQTYRQKEIGDSLYKEQKPFFKKSLRPGKKVEKVNAVHYTGQFRIKDIEKVTIPENVFWILRANGKVFTRDL